MSKCECEGLKVAIEMADLYSKVFVKPREEVTMEDHKKASEITEKILSRISKEDIYEGQEPGLSRYYLEEAKLNNLVCRREEYAQRLPCTMALEDARASLHANWGLRQKLVCGPKFEPGNQTKSAETLMIALFQLRGTFKGSAVDTLRERFKEAGCGK